MPRSLCLHRNAKRPCVGSTVYFPRSLSSSPTRESYKRSVLRRSSIYLLAVRDSHRTTRSPREATAVRKTEKQDIIDQIKKDLAHVAIFKPSKLELRLLALLHTEDIRRVVRLRSRGQTRPPPFAPSVGSVCVCVCARVLYLEAIGMVW